MKIYNVMQYGVINDGVTLTTEYLQKVIDDCNKNGGGTVFFPKGKYLLSTVFLRSNINLQFEEGVEILGSLDFNDYNDDEKVDYPLYQDASHSFFECSMFVAIGCENISFDGKCKIDMRSVWDEENKRNIVHRGAKCIALKNCKNVTIKDVGVYNATDLAIYFAGCEHVLIRNVKMRVYIDGISPDNSKHVLIENCDVESGDDGIVFKSSYTLNKLDICQDITVRNCKISSRCNAIKFGTETNGGFKDILVENVEVENTRITGISIESVDGAVLEDVTVRNVKMRNAGTPLFIHLGERMRGPKDLNMGRIKNVRIENVRAEGPYKPYECIEWNYDTYVKQDKIQYPGIFGNKEDFENHKWQITSNVCGLENYPLENIILKDVYFEVDGGAKEYSETVPEKCNPYPEVNVYGKVLPSKGIYFRHIKGLTLDNVVIKTLNEDARRDYVFDDVEDLRLI